MPILETWLLPDGVADVLPEQAKVVESLRRKCLDFLATRGYQLVYTPMIEYIESLSSLSESGQDLDLVTFKLIDQLSGRLIGVRADMTPQIARIDAHVYPVNGVARYCYAGAVLHTTAQHFNASRSPLQLGAELYGHDSVAADLEMIDVMLGLVEQSHITEHLHLDLGHVELFRSMVKIAGLSKAQERHLSNIYQRKSLPELLEFSQQLNYGEDFYHLGRFASDLEQLQQYLSDDILNNDAFKNALHTLQAAKQHIQQLWPQVEISVDVVELRSYHYHTGLVYAVYAPHHATALAQGGRYDGIGEHYGRSRPATGFSCDLYTLCAGQFQQLDVVVAPNVDDVQLKKAIAQARLQGRSVVQLLGDDDLSSVPYATQQFKQIDGQWRIVNL
ncbi:MAG: ATP phosphoribosyltransferase regulatory subunit [Acinetobacter sp.]|nr:ATP phosphoribosyltransferase regulatory subunit [Acinetobacter sp.]